MTGHRLWAEVELTEVPPGCIALWWLYQAGFVVKGPGGTTLRIDPYLSNVVERTYGQPRAVPAPLAPAEVRADAVLGPIATMII